jgi:hypothetical protein
MAKKAKAKSKAKAKKAKRKAAKTVVRKAKRPVAKKTKKAKTAKAAKKIKAATRKVKKAKKAAPKKAAVKKAAPKAAAPKKPARKAIRPQRPDLPDIVKHDLDMKLETTALRGAVPHDVGAVLHGMAPAAPAHAPLQNNTSRIAVVASVNGFMDDNRPGWNADGQGDTRKLGADYHYPAPSIPAPVLTDIRGRLNGKGYTFVITPALVQKCIAGTVGDVKYEIWQVTTLK